ncbi:MAG: type II toxin-antitoxin system VapC family toxin [Geminicoccaceae bacterium]
MLVVDASAVAGWLFPDEAGPDLQTLSSHYQIFMAPWLFWVEFRNILVMSERRGRLPKGFADQAIEAVDNLGVILDTDPSNATTLALARRHGLTVYDALYLELALRKGGDLVTLDKALAKAVRAEGIAIDFP